MRPGAGRIAFELPRCGILCFPWRTEAQSLRVSRATCRGILVLPPRSRASSPRFSRVLIHSTAIRSDFREYLFLFKVVPVPETVSNLVCLFKGSLQLLATILNHFCDYETESDQSPFVSLLELESFGPGERVRLGCAARTEAERWLRRNWNRLV